MNEIIKKRPSKKDYVDKHISKEYFIKKSNDALSKYDTSEFLRLMGLYFRGGDYGNSIAVFIAEQNNFSYNSLYKAASADGNPSLRNIVNIFKTLNIEISIKALSKDNKEQ